MTNSHSILVQEDYSEMLKLMNNMKLREQNELKEALSILKKTNIEDMRFLLIYLNIELRYGEYINTEELLNIYNNNHSYIYSCFKHYLSSNYSPKNTLDKLIRFKNSSLIPDCYLTWFSDDLRATLFIGNITNYDYRELTFYGYEDYLNFIKLTNKILSIELKNYGNSTIAISHIIPNSETSNIENNIEKLKYIKKTYLENRLPSKLVKWLYSEDNKQIQWAYDYLDTRELLIMKGIFYPKSNDEMYQLILATLDAKNNKDKTHEVKNGKNASILGERDFLIHQMRKAWNSILDTERKFKDKDKRMITVYQNNYENLLSLSVKLKIPPNKIVNNLINEKFEQTFND